MTDKSITGGPRIEANGPIIGVVVHGRGAVITRRITVEGDVPTDSFDLVIGGITPLADPGSVRVTLPEDGRSLVGVNARIVVPETDGGPGPSTELVERLTRQIGRLHERENALKERVKRLQAVLLVPIGKKALKAVGPTGRLDFALAMGEVIASTVASIDERILDLSIELDRVVRERQAAQLEDQQTSGSERSGEGHPSQAFELRIAAGDQQLSTVDLCYAVPYAAKWWPQYTLRLMDGGSRATLSLEALVAQRTGEDWEGVPVGLSTAAIIFDATLPKLASLRLGKRQPTESRGFREPPTGAERLFDSYDSFGGRLAPSPPKAVSGARAMYKPAPVEESWDYEEDFDDDTGSFGEGAAEAAYDMMDAERLPIPQASMAPPMEMASMEMAPPPMQKMMKKRGAPGMVAGALAAPFAVAANAIGSLTDHTRSSGAGGGGWEGGGEGAPGNGHDPGDGWLAFDSLVMGGRDAPQRGRLTRRPPAAGLPASELFDAQDSARRMNLTDPVVSRGLFDYRYDADGSARIPADGRLHRIEVAQQPADSQLEWRTVPLVDPAVYREAVLRNPFKSPLLAGPVDVFSEGQYVTGTHISRVDAGGTMRVGLGVDERIRVVRNLRMVEESAGLLGGKRELIHDIEIELRSGLGDSAKVEVVDRIPVTSDDHVEVEFIRESANSDAYDQAEQDHPIEGGRRWVVELEAGGRSTLQYRYQITVRSKDELVGGNRRG